MSLVAVVLAGTPTTASAGPDPGQDKEIVTGEVPELELFKAQQPLMDAATVITGLDPSREGLGGVRLQVEQNTLEVYWKGDLPEAVKAEIERQEQAGVRIALGSAAYSGAELAAAQQWIVETPERYKGLAVVAPEPDGSGLHAYFDDPKAAASYEFPVPVAIEQTPEGTEPVSRFSDTPPFWGGAVTRTPAGTCSTGFAVIQGFTTGVLSAGHCDPAGGGLFTTGTGLTIGRSRPPVSISDSIVIPTRAAGRVYWGPPSTSASLGILGPTPNFPGQFVCTSGARTGTNCPIQNVWVAGASFVGGALRLGVTIGIKWFGGLATGSGDSGGPVVMPLSPLHGLAAGLMSFAVAGGRCPDGGGGVCSGIVGYIDINWVLATQALVLAP